MYLAVEGAFVRLRQVESSAHMYVRYTYLHYAGTAATAGV
jgi:hypothetical protein